MFPPQQQGPPMGGMGGMPGMGGGMGQMGQMGQMSADPGRPGGFAGSLGQDPSTPQPPQIDPQLVQLLLAQLQADGLEGGMQPEAQAMIPLDPLAGMMGLSSQMPGTSPGMGMTPGMPGGMGGFGMPGGTLPPAFSQAQQMAAARPQSAGSY